MGERDPLRPRLVGVDARRRPRAARLRALRFGCVWINDHIPLVSEMPHGGFKESGYGKDLSVYSLEDYTVVKHVMARARGRRGGRPTSAERGAVDVGRRGPGRSGDRRGGDAVGTAIGAVSIDPRGAMRGLPVRRPSSRAAASQLAPMRMPLRAEPYGFPGLVRGRSFQRAARPAGRRAARPLGHGAGRRLAALAGSRGVSFDVVERLCYVGTRGDGRAGVRARARAASPVDADLQVDALVRLANELLASARSSWPSCARTPTRRRCRRSSPSAARRAARARRRSSPTTTRTGQVRSGQVAVGEGFRTGC